MKRLFPVALAALALAGTTRCYSEFENKTTPTASGGGANLAPPGGTADSSVVEPPPDDPPKDGGNFVPTKIVCQPARTGEALPARTAVMSAQAPEVKKMLTGDLYTEFKAQCGSCHVSLANGDYQIKQNSFATDISKNLEGEDIGTAAIDRIFDDESWMPPEEVVPNPPSERDARTDQFLRLGRLLRAWFEQGKPTDFFTPPEEEGTQRPQEQSYLLTEAVGKALTNLGNCIPDRLATSETDATDQRFEGDALPRTLAETDLTTFDSLELAKHGVVAYAPAYPLWSDDARKLRHVRVPRGTSIRFDKETQSFEIPENARFYKTFSKKVVERDGSERYRKIETRLIVAREPKMVDGQLVQTALFGTYEWNDPETEAVLSNKLRRDGTPFADRILTLTTDEKKYDDTVAAHTSGADLTAALQAAGAIRHYAIPGSERCIQCHMGSPTNDFVLGFLPLQVKWRPTGEGGVIEEAGEDELNQLERMIDYGLVTGIESVDDVLPLERSQGAREPRNDEELIAQGYLLGNCAHCHNTRGFPTVENPELRDLLNFLPGPGPNDGVFQFPLERYSPRIGRGVGGTVRMPYITPSLVDYPSTVDVNYAAAHGTVIPGDGTTSPGTPPYLVLAPWRSLLYRNVDSPFPYSVDVALFPHMPMNTPGFDCRAPRILGEWMVSIPSFRKKVLFDETAVQGNLYSDARTRTYDATGTDRNEQPYTEVSPGASAFEGAKLEAQRRLHLYRTGEDPSESQLRPLVSSTPRPQFYTRHAYCVDTGDIVDPSVKGDQAHLVPSDLIYWQGKDRDGNDELKTIPTNYNPVKGYPLLYTEQRESKKDSWTLVWPDEGVPDRPHWVQIESGEPPGEWTPRRASDWKQFLVEHKVPDSPNKTPQARADEALVLELLKSVTLTSEVRAFAKRANPFGLWINKDQCRDKFAKAGVKPVSEYTQERPLWMDTAINAKAVPEALVYAELPGASIFNMVCQNCHGTRADARGRQADTLQAMTGGDARVADFRYGLFGPESDPGANRAKQFDAGQGLTPDDWAARYLAWMALGGTEKLIPKAILNVVSITPVLGQVRRFAGADSANMLGPIQNLCGAFFNLSVQATGGETETNYLAQTDPYPKPPNWSNYAWDHAIENLAQKNIFLKTIGDPELLAAICSLDNPTPIRRLNLAGGGGANTTFIRAKDYPAGREVGTHRGTVEQGLSTSNHLPWCVYGEYPTDPGETPVPFQTVDGKPLPRCPDVSSEVLLTRRELESWAFRGAINAGLMVFIYLDELMHDRVTPLPPYDRCESLP